MKRIKLFYFIMLAGLIFTMGCEGDKAEGGNEEQTFTIDSLNTILSNYEAEESELSKKIVVLQAKLDEEPLPQEVKVIYKTKVKYKTDDAVLEDLASQKSKVHSQYSEIEQLRDTITLKENEIGKMQILLDELESKNNEVLDSFDITGIDSIIKNRLAISDIEVELFTRKVKDKKKKRIYIEIIETSFTINENKLASKGDKTIHLCIYDSDQNVLHHLESETFKPLKGVEQFYTTENQFLYDEEKLRMTVPWEKKELELKPGMYITEFYIDNVFSGIGVFDVE